MKRLFVLFIAIACLFAFTVPAISADENQLLTAKVTSVVQAKTKAGDAYTRAVIEVPGELNGIKFPDSRLLMFFGDMASKGSALKAGQTVSVIAAPRVFNGRTSYTALAIVPPQSAKQ